MTCYTLRDHDGAATGTILCGDLGPACRYCGDVSTRLCDFPLGMGKTCDAPMCDRCASPQMPPSPRPLTASEVVDRGVFGMEEIRAAMLASMPVRTEDHDWCAEHADTGPVMLTIPIITPKPKPGPVKPRVPVRLGVQPPAHLRWRVRAATGAPLTSWIGEMDARRYAHTHRKRGGTVETWAEWAAFVAAHNRKPPRTKRRKPAKVIQMRPPTKGTSP